MRSTDENDENELSDESFVPFMNKNHYPILLYKRIQLHMYIYMGSNNTPTNSLQNVMQIYDSKLSRMRCRVYFL